MENYERMTIPVLKNLAKERGLRGYSRLNKSQLLQRLREHGSTILDQDNDTRMTNVPFLTPTPYTPTQATPTQATPTLSSNAVENLLDYLDKNVREIPKRLSYRSAPELRRLLNLKKLRKEIDEIYGQIRSFEVRESNFALKRFAKVYTINGIEKYDPRTFLFYARKNMTEILKNNRTTKVKIILYCDMIHNIKNIIREFAFHSNIEVNLEGTDADDLYVIMTERILEKNS